MSTVDPKQKIDTFEVSVNNGNFNVRIEGTVGKKAYIALHDKETPLKYDNYLTYYYLQNFVDYTAIDYDDSEDFPLMKASGKNWINYNVSSEMRIVIWDSTPGNPTIYLPQYICRIPKYLAGHIQNSFSPPPGPPYPPEVAHSQYVLTCRVFLNNSDWNIVLDGVFSKKAWVGLYQGSDDLTSKNYTKSDYIINFATTTRKAVHRDEKIILIFYESSYWFNYRAQTDCYFVIWDILFSMDGSDEDDVAKRYILHIPELIQIEVERNYS